MCIRGKYFISEYGMKRFHVKYEITFILYVSEGSILGMFQQTFSKFQMSPQLHNTVICFRSVMNNLKCLWIFLKTQLITKKCFQLLLFCEFLHTKRTNQHFWNILYSLTCYGESEIKTQGIYFIVKIYNIFHFI